jgi:predicted enzyme related to lactoylglutathione lyase
MERVRGIGGVFFKAKDPKALGAWYQQHLGVPVETWGGASFRWKDDDLDGNATTAWSVFADDSQYFAPSKKPFMINFRVKSLDRMLAQLKLAGAEIDPKTDSGEFGRFGWVMDPEGNRIELWEPPHLEGGPAPTPPASGHDVAPAVAPAKKKPAKKPAAKKKATKKRSRK